MRAKALYCHNEASPVSTRKVKLLEHRQSENAASRVASVNACFWQPKINQDTSTVAVPKKTLLSEHMIFGCTDKNQ